MLHGVPTASSCRTASASAVPRARSRRCSTRASSEIPVPRHLLRHADGGDRVRAPRCRARPGANSTEIDPDTPHPVIDLPARAAQDPGQGRDDAARRLPVHARFGKEGTRAHEIYGKTRDLRAPPSPLRVQPRVPRAPRSRRASPSRAPHRTAASSRSSSSTDHPFFVASQFHPEFLSRPFDAASRSSSAFVEAAAQARGSRGLGAHRFERLNSARGSSEHSRARRRSAAPTVSDREPSPELSAEISPSRLEFLGGRGR